MISINSGEDFYGEKNGRGMGEAKVGGNERCFKRHGKRDVRGVIRREIFSQLPHNAEQVVVRIPVERHLLVVHQRLVGAQLIETPRKHVASKHMQYLDVDQTMRIHIFVVQSISKVAGSWPSEQDLEDGGGVNDDHVSRALPAESLQEISG